MASLDDASSFSSGSARAGCKWRTSSFHVGECARYFDCPTHTVERALSDHEDHAGEEEPFVEPPRASAGASHRGYTADGPAPTGPPMSVSPLSEDGQVEGESEIARPSHNSRHTNSYEAGRSIENPIDLAEDVPAVSGPDPGLPDSQPPPPLRPPRSFEEIQARPARITPPPTNPPTLAGQSGVAPAQPSLALTLGPPVPAVPAESRPQPGQTNTITHPPRWQPDAEATSCPICHTQFSMFVRKHHCRKCGRVVCDACSPHRITIPYQYIVQPPGAELGSFAQAYARSVLLGNQGAALEPSGIVGGGARVRLCNPCVPDPNTAPPSAQPSALQQSHVRSHTINSDQPYRQQTNSGENVGRSRSVTMRPGDPSFHLPSNRPPTGPVKYPGPATPYLPSPVIYQPIQAQSRAFPGGFISRVNRRPNASGNRRVPYTSEAAAGEPPLLLSIPGDFGWSGGSNMLSPGLAIGQGGSMVMPPGPAVGTPGLMVGTPGPVVGAPGLIVGTPGPVVGTPRLMVGTPGTPGTRVGAPGLMVGTPGSTMVGMPGTRVGPRGPMAGPGESTVVPPGTMVGLPSITVGPPGVMVSTRGTTRTPGAIRISPGGPNMPGIMFIPRATIYDRDPPPPRAQVAEEDECPVCHHELPWRTVPNFEALREQHIDACVKVHSSSVGGSSRLWAALGPEAARPGLSRRTGMFPYTATEKDCANMAECSICLEEFEAGVPMARLECLCRFHRACIDAWWERHPGRCPMHQHDGFGF